MVFVVKDMSFSFSETDMSFLRSGCEFIERASCRVGLADAGNRGGCCHWIGGGCCGRCRDGGGFLGVGFYWGREVAQAERKLGTPPWWSGLDIRKWSQDAVLDLVCPLVVCSAAVIAVWVAA